MRSAGAGIALVRAVQAVESPLAAALLAGDDAQIR